MNMCCDKMLCLFYLCQYLKVEFQNYEDIMIQGKNKRANVGCLFSDRIYIAYEKVIKQDKQSVNVSTHVDLYIHWQRSLVC
jgi:hypothetical protein